MLFCDVSFHVCDWVKSLDALRTGDMTNAYEIVVGNLKGRDPLEYLGLDGRITLVQTLKKQSGEVRAGRIWLRIGTSDWSCEHGNEPSGSIKSEEFLDHLSDY